MSAGVPEGVEPYKRTLTFSESTVPAGLMQDHSTKDGVWGLICVEEGSLRYLVADPRRPAFEQVLSPEGAPGVIEPTITHRVELIGSVRFYVEFLRKS